jgi:hypothetical protein
MQYRQQHIKVSSEALNRQASKIMEKEIGTWQEKK